MIKFGIDSYVIAAPWSLILSILMFSGACVLGFLFLKFTNLDKIIKKISYLQFQLPTFGFLILLIIIYPLILFNLLNADAIKFLGILLILLNLYCFKFYKYFPKSLGKLKKNISFDFYLIFFLIFGYFLISLGPITSADSLDYHTSTAIHILNYGKFPDQYYWFHNRSSGSGEILISLGLSLGAEQFGSLVQFAGLMTIVGLIINLCHKQGYKDDFTKFFVLLFLAIPILVFLNSTNKPQLFAIGLTSICFVLTFVNFEYFNKKEKLISYVITLVLLIEAFLIKYSFLLSCLIIGFYLFFLILDKKNYIYVISYTIVIIFLIYLPFSIWKYINFDKNILYSLFLALPQHLYGYDAFMQSISSCGYNCYPTWFFIPRSISEITNFFGILFCLIIFLKIKNKKNIIILISLLIYISFGLGFAQSNPRFFFEPAIWYIFLLILSSKFTEKKLYKYLFKPILRIQSLAIIFIIYFGIFNLLPGSIFNSYRTEVLNKNANGYSLLSWASKELDKNDIILSPHRSVAIPTIKTVPLFFINYLDPKNPRSTIYFNEIKREKPNYIILTDNVDKFKKIFKSCIGNKVFFKKDIDKLATRNPFIPRNYKDGFIYDFHHERLPGCVLD